MYYLLFFEFVLLLTAEFYDPDRLSMSLWEFFLFVFFFTAVRGRCDDVTDCCRMVAEEGRNIRDRRRP